ncbi:hypothetical protein [Ensifer sp. SL37]|uniref:hypothetical protein n=1 Tax=Ensifer sp. SL37 TaxID=2995137 RepID=UPI0022730A9A|nr:hypothetical protein [Ensifer sp. SL37]MCY1740521.1 hypothetical protein [Ensifer sp. SL37]
MRSWCILTFSSIGCCFLLAGSIRAADVYSPMMPQAQQKTVESGWSISFAPYFWAAGLSGDIAQFGLPTVHADASFRDITDHLDFGAMAIGEARYDPYSIFGDVMYTKISGETGTPKGILATDAQLKSETFAGFLGVGYSVFEDNVSRLDIVGGLRVWSVESELSFRGGLLDGVSRTDRATWVDGLAGFRGTYAITQELYLTGWGLIGTGAARLDWDVAAAMGYRFSDTVSAVAGFRILGADYSDNHLIFDIVQKGPILGLVVRF